MGGERVKTQSGKSLWKPEEDLILKNYVEAHGEGKWATVSKRSGLMRGGKSCRLRWKNYLRPNIKHGGMSEQEEDLIIRMHNLIGNRWSLIAGRLPGRTDNEVKNYWNTHLNKNQSRQSKRKLDEAENQTKKKTRVHAPTCREKRGPERKGSAKKREEEEAEFSITNQGMDNEAGSYETETPSPSMIPIEPAFGFDDAEQLISLLDSFVFYEAFGCTNRASEEASMEVLRSAMAKI